MLIKTPSVATVTSDSLVVHHPNKLDGYERLFDAQCRCPIREGQEDPPDSVPPTSVTNKIWKEKKKHTL